LLDLGLQVGGQAGQCLQRQVVQLRFRCLRPAQQAFAEANDADHFAFGAADFFAFGAADFFAFGAADFFAFGAADFFAFGAADFFALQAGCVQAGVVI
jgi:hypothetical protein